jgi:hypothetical protein
MNCLERIFQFSPSLKIEPLQIGDGGAQQQRVPVGTDHNTALQL